MKRGLVTLSTLFVISSVAQAAPGDLAYRKAVAARSEASALSGAYIQPLTPVEGPGRDRVLADVVARFAPTREGSVASSPRMKNDVDSSMATGDGWFAEVRGTGEWVRFRNDAYLNNGHLNPPRPMDVRLSAADLEPGARAIITGELSAYVRLGPTDDLKEWQASYMVNSSTDAAGNTETDVIATRIIFTRVIDGVPVLGPGGKVSVILANDGTLVGFDVDWPELKVAGAKSGTASLAVVRNREAALLGINAAAALPPEHAFECGYYDPGVFGRTSGGRIAAACVIVLESTGFRPKLIIPLDGS